MLGGEQHGNELHCLEFRKALQLHGDRKTEQSVPPGRPAPPEEGRWRACKRRGCLNPASEQEFSVSEGRCILLRSVRYSPRAMV